MKRTKLKGFMVIQAVVMSLLLGMLGLSFVQIYGGQFSALAANRKALQAQQFAQSEADYLKNTAYASLASAAHGKTAISGANGWMSQVTLGSESTVNGVKQRNATVSIYRNSTATSPDYSLTIPLSSAGSNGRNYVKNDSSASNLLSLKYDSGALKGFVDNAQKYFDLGHTYVHNKTATNNLLLDLSGDLIKGYSGTTQKYFDLGTTYIKNNTTAKDLRLGISSGNLIQAFQGTTQRYFDNGHIYTHNITPSYNISYAYNSDDKIVDTYVNGTKIVNTIEGDADISDNGFFTLRFTIQVQQIKNDTWIPVIMVFAKTTSQGGRHVPLQTSYTGRARKATLFFCERIFHY